MIYLNTKIWIIVDEKEWKKIIMIDNNNNDNKFIYLFIIDRKEKLNL